MFRTGFGYDIHPLKKGRRLVLGGLAIPYPKGAVGHSDGDGLIHAIIDALLGATGGGDIGRLFPDTEGRFKDASSLKLLGEVVAGLRAGGWSLVNVDAVVVIEEPKIGPHVEGMKAALCPVLGLDAGALNIKAKTNERLGPIGKGRAVACWAAALVRK